MCFHVFVRRGEGELKQLSHVCVCVSGPVCVSNHTHCNTTPLHIRLTHYDPDVQAPDPLPVLLHQTGDTLTDACREDMRKQLSFIVTLEV